MPRSGLGWSSRTWADSLSFNEAGAIMPRSGRPRVSLPCGVAAASMRPGQSCPGVVTQITSIAGISVERLQ